MFTDSNIPKCQKCHERIALSLLNDMWVCGQCLHEYIQKKIKEKQDIFLKG